MFGKNSNTRDTLKFKLDALLEITRAINENQPAQVLLDDFSKILCQQLKIGKVVMFVNSRRGWECILHEGVDSSKIAKINIENMLPPFREITFVPSSHKEQLSIGFDIVIPVYNNNLPIAYVLIGDIEEEMEGISPVIKHIQFIQTLSNIIAVALENIRLFQESLRQEAIRKELELASQMQNMLIPTNNELPRDKHLHVASFYKPHQEVGGDYFDCIRLSDEETGFCVADVSGKGVPAALLMSNFQAALHALFTSRIPMETLIRKLNTQVINSAKGEKFITLFVGRYNHITHYLEYVNAGHTATLLYGMKSKKISLLESTTTGLGMLEMIPKMTVGRIKIEEHSMLLTYTDGLIEVLADGYEGRVTSNFPKLEQIISQSENIDSVIDTIIETLNLRGENHAFFDDITLLGIEMFPL